mmetsp:Transcript_98873/g.255575  ORF Transcript_98873/g.255575 Transcript_98873/m.255575 type:complete len:236 (-) Transcript_98873:846-1553(-)
MQQSVGAMRRRILEWTEVLPGRLVLPVLERLVLAVLAWKSRAGAYATTHSEQHTSPPADNSGSSADTPERRTNTSTSAGAVRMCPQHILGRRFWAVCLGPGFLQPELRGIWPIHFSRRWILWKRELEWLWAMFIRAVQLLCGRGVADLSLPSPSERENPLSSLRIRSALQRQGLQRMLGQWAFQLVFLFQDARCSEPWRIREALLLDRLGQHHRAAAAMACQRRWQIAAHLFPDE